jgi:hypothetical protein
MNQNIRTIGGAVGTQSIAAIIAGTAVAQESRYVASFLVIGGVSLVGVLAAWLVPRDRTRAA